MKAELDVWILCLFTKNENTNSFVYCIKEKRGGRRRVGVGGGDPQTVLSPSRHIPLHNTDTLRVNDLSSLRPPCMCCNVPTETGYNVRPADRIVGAYNYLMVFTIPKINNLYANRCRWSQRRTLWDNTLTSHFATQRLLKNCSCIQLF